MGNDTREHTMIVGTNNDGDLYIMCSCGWEHIWNWMTATFVDIQDKGTFHLANTHLAGSVK